MLRVSLMRTFCRVLSVLLVLLLSACSAHSDFPADTPASQPDHNLAATLAELDSQPAPDGVDSDVYDQLKAEFKRVMMELYPDGKLPSAGPPVDSSCSSVTALDGDNQLQWYMENPGDYNQDGLVSVNDLTPLGFYFNEAGPFSPDSAQYVVDGNHDGLIGVSDITPIGQNFGNQITVYNVYASDDLTDHPRSTSAKSVSAATLLGSVNVADVTAEAGARKQFSYDASAVTEENIWVAGSDGDAEGVASTAVSGRWHTIDNILPTGVDGTRASIAILDDGRLAVAYYVPANLTIQYMESLDAAGGSWEDPITIATNVAPNNYPQVNLGQYGVYIGYFAMGVFTVSNSYDEDHDNWISFELTATGGTSSLRDAARTASGPTAPLFCWVGAFGDHTHGLYVLGNMLFHVGCVGTGAVYTGTAMSGMQVTVDEAAGTMRVSFFDNGKMVIGTWSEDSGWEFQNAVNCGAPETYGDYTTPSVMANAVVGAAYPGDANQLNFSFEPTGSDSGYQTFSFGELDGTDQTFKAVHTGDNDSEPGELTDPRFSPFIWLVDDAHFGCLVRAAKYLDPAMSPDMQLFAATMVATQDLDEYESRVEAASSYQFGNQTTAAVHSANVDGNI